MKFDWTMNMVEMTVTEFVRNLITIFDRIARIVPGSAHLTAIEAMGDLYQTLPEDAARGWLAESRTNGTLENEARGLRRADKISGL